MDASGKRVNRQGNGVKDKHSEMLWETMHFRSASDCARNKAQQKSTELRQTHTQSPSGLKETKV